MFYYFEKKINIVKFLKIDSMYYVIKNNDNSNNR